MNQITVKQLAAELLKEVKAGNGDKVIVLSDDTEGNGYHGMFFSITADPKTVKECIDSSNGLYDSVTEDPKKIVIVG